MEFNKSKFATHLDKAKGKRSINKFGADTGVDPGYISRLLRCLVESAPSANIIIKLAERTHNDVSREELMAAAGYIDLNSKLLDATETTKSSDGVKEQTSTYDPGIDVFFKDFASAPKEKQEEMLRFWNFIKEQEKGRKPGDKQGE